jgi:tetratricopeptide (TPR) repeat protein
LIPGILVPEQDLISFLSLEFNTKPALTISAAINRYSTIQIVFSTLLCIGLFSPVSIQGSGEDMHREELSRSRKDQNSSNEIVEELLWAGIDAMYSYRFREATALLDSVLILDPTHVVAPFVAVANQWLRTETEQGYAASHDSLFSAINATIPRYEALETQNKQRPDILLFLGSTYGLRARIHLAYKNWISVLYSGIKGWNQIRTAHGMDSTLADAYLPIGIFSYYTGTSSTPIQFAARLFGILPDRNAGLGFLERAALEAPHAWIEAAYILSQIYLYIEDDPENAFRHTDRLMKRYPENYDFSFLRAEELVRLNRVEEAKSFMPHLETHIAQSHPNQRLEWDLKYAALEAALAYSIGESEIALERSQWVIDHYDMEFDWHLGFVYYFRGKIREKRGDWERARDDYQYVIDLDNRTYAIDQARTALLLLEQSLDSK